MNSCIYQEVVEQWHNALHAQDNVVQQGGAQAWHIMQSKKQRSILWWPILSGNGAKILGHGAKVLGRGAKILGRMANISGQAAKILGQGAKIKVNRL